MRVKTILWLKKKNQLANSVHACFVMSDWDVTKQNKASCLTDGHLLRVYSKGTAQSTL